MVTAALSLRAYFTVVDLMAHYGFGAAERNHETVAGLMRSLLTSAAIFSILGLFVGAVGTGIFFNREWARKVWLWAVLILLLFHLERLSLAFGGDVFIIFIRVAEVACVGAIAVFSRIYLRKDSTRAYFKNGNN